MESTALIINEFGEIGVDNLLIESAIENTLLLENGCICCSLRGDLIDTISDLFAKVRNGNIPAFSRIVIETTGLADPSPIVNSLLSETSVTNRCNVKSVISMVDGVQGVQQINEYKEAVMQVVQANLGLISKSDLSTSGKINELVSHLHHINPTLTVKEIQHGNIDPDTLFSNHPGTLELPNLSEYENHSGSPLHSASEQKLGHHGISSWSLVHEFPVDQIKLWEWFSMIYSLKPYQMLRTKGIIRVSQSSSPLLLEAVGKVVSPLKWLREWPNNKQQTQLVMIFKGLSKEALAASFQSHVLS